MPINPDAVGFQTEPTLCKWSSTDCILYALGVGAGQDDPTGFELEFTTENTQDHPQRVLPTFAVVAGSVVGIGALHQIGPFNPAMLVHAEQAMEVHQPLPTDGRVEMVSRVAAIYDKGSAAIVVIEANASDAESKTPLFTSATSLFIRGEGGWDGDRGPASTVQIPDRTPDHEVSYTTRTDQPLLYRLSGDRNPLHSDPKFAALAGFERPILHGLCTFGLTGRALLHTVCRSDPDRFRSMTGRFSKPVFPGDTLTVSIWDDGAGEALFRTTTEGGTTALDLGRMTYSG